MENRNLNMRKEMNSKTAEELRKEDVEREMKKIKERMQQRLREINTESSLKKQEEEQKAKVEALRQKLQRERQAQIIREIAERNAVEHKATVKAAQIAARKEQEAREAEKTPDFNLEEKRKKMMDAYYTQQDKVKARKLMGAKVDLELAENNLEETKAAQKRMKQTEKYMQELREEQAKKIEEEKKEKTSAIKNIFNKLTSLPRRKIPTQEELSNAGLREGLTMVNSVNNKGMQEERVKHNLEMSKDIPYMDKEEVIQPQKPSEELSYQDKNLKELYDVAVGRKTMTKEEADRSFKEGREREKRKKQAEEARKEAEIVKEKEKQRTLHKMSYAAQQYLSKLFNQGQKLSKKDEKTRNTNQRTKSDMFRDLKCKVDEQLAFENYVQKAQNNKGKGSIEHKGLGRIA